MVLKMLEIPYIGIILHLLPLQLLFSFFIHTTKTGRDSREKYNATKLVCRSNSLISSYIAIIMLLWCLLPFLLLALTFVAELFLSKTALRYCLFKENVSFLHQCLFSSVYFLSSCSMGFFMLLWVWSMILTPRFFISSFTVVCNWDETLVNNPYINEVTLTGKNLSLKCL